MSAERDPGAELGRVFAFVVELDRLKGVLRRTRPVGLERRENSAEHSWHVALAALLLAPYAREPVDLQRVLEILLVHDVPEIDCGDQFVYARDPAETAAAEGVAAERLFALLPAELGARLLARWREFEERRTPEARLAYAADRLLPVLQNLFGGAHSWREHAVPRERVKEINAAIGEACPLAWQQLEPLIDELFTTGAAAPGRG